MSKKTVMLGSAIVAVMSVFAMDAAGASALSVSLETCTQATGTATEYTSGSCTTVGSGGFHRVATSQKAVKIATPSTFVLKSTDAGIEFQISCTGVSGESVAKDAGEVITSSAAPLTFSGCTVTKPSGKGCVVKAGGGATGTIVTKNLVSETTRTGTSTYSRLDKPAEGTLFAAIEVSGCSTTALNGTKNLTGTAKAIVTGEMDFEYNSTTGSFLDFAGQNAVFTGTVELQAADNGATDEILVGP